MNGLHPFSFADADTAYESARYVIFGVPYDGTTSFRAGTRRGPRAIREFSYNFETYSADTGVDLAEVPVADIGDVEPLCLPGDVVLQVEELVRSLHRDGKIPLMLGGEHSVTLGAVKAVMPDCYVVCDAHLDLREEYGNTPYNHACITRRVLEEGAGEIFIIGARSGTREEYAIAKEHHLYSAEEVRKIGIDAVLTEVAGKIAGKRVYLSIDADVIDCCLAPGVGTPEPFGLSPLDIREVIRKIGPSASAFDYVEVAPFDAGQTAAVAARLIREFIAVHWRSGA
ncbi:MAG: agmatinase [Methanomicrobiaceae archaeon]|nr:agmatinase [Methanomicrobiaceae archaeon]